MSKVYAFRLHPGDDLKKQIEAFVQANLIEAGWIACGIGSLTAYHLRFANHSSGTQSNGFFEIISLSGTVSVHGLHLHMCIGETNGQTIAGHLLEGNLINTTAEIIIQEATDIIFFRENDKTTGWKEIQIKKK